MSTSLILKLSVGATKASPAPRTLIEALSTVEVERVDQPGGGFELVFASQYSASDQDHPLLAGGELEPFNRTVISVLVNGKTNVLMDGYITDREVVLDPGSQGSQVVIKGVDATIIMNLVEISQGYENKDDLAIVNDVLKRYKPLGVKADAQKPAAQVTPDRNIPQQRTTDLQFLVALAERNDHLFYIKPGPTEGKSTAYWGPREKKFDERPPLIAPGAPFANVESLSPRHDALASGGNYGKSLGTSAEPEAGFSATAYEGSRKLADKKPPAPKISADVAAWLAQNVQTLETRLRLFEGDSWSIPESKLAAQARTDRDGGATTKMTGELDTLKYMAVLEAPGMVQVRGSGKKFDGDYYVSQVSHKISFGQSGTAYRQSFTLEREGLGSTTS